MMEQWWKFYKTTQFFFSSTTHKFAQFLEIFRHMFIVGFF